ncbi:MAG: Ig-like domain-containing protein, partial [Polyangiaceae bacterium]|nr:Ig-like domain-containing protein [Polyangiaceae bacterium]
MLGLSLEHWRAVQKHLGAVVCSWLRIVRKSVKPNYATVAKTREALAPNTRRPVFEALEPRLLLSADLVPVPPSQFTVETLTPADLAPIVVVIENLGDQTPVEPVRVALYASNDLLLDAGDSAVGSAMLPGGSLVPGALTPAQATLSVGQVAAPGTYALLARVDADDGVPEADEANNVAQVGTLDIIWSVGQVGDRVVPQITVPTPGGAPATFSFAGPGTATIAPTMDGFDLALGTTRFAGTLTIDTGALTLRAGLDSTPVAGYADLSGSVQSDGSFTLDRTTLDALAGGALTEGAHLLNLVALDASANATTLQLAFTLDTLAPAAPTLDLDPASDTGTIGDQQTSAATVTLVGSTEPGATVRLVELDRSTTADAQGAFAFDTVALALGSNVFTVQATDLAGNTRQASHSFTRVEAVFADYFLDTPFGALVQAMPERSWAKVNINRFDSVWVPEQLQAQGGLGQPKSVIEAWSSMAWDSKRGDLIFWGGGHANYNGNEVYRWNAATLEWERASLPSKVVQVQSPQFDTVDGAFASPVSSHTYDNSEYLPIVDRFITFGGAAAHTGSIFLAQNPDGTWRPTGPYLWDPSKANANLVGGLDGSGVDPTTPGGQMWQNRDNNQFGHTEGTTAYAEIGGKDALFVELNHGVLLRYVLNDVDNPALDTYEIIGGTNPYVFTGQGAGAYDPVHNVYLRTAVKDSAGVARLVYWDIDLAAPTNWNRFATLNDPSGTFKISWDMGLDYDPVRGTFVAWNGSGDLWAISAPSNLSDPWNVEPLRPGGAVVPNVGSISGAFTGVLGKWKYVSGLDLFAGVIDPYSGDVWIYKPSQWTHSDSNALVSPTITALTPAQTVAGAAVTLTGTNFGKQQGTGSVQFGGIATTVDAWSDTQIVARAPAGLAGPVTVRVATS